MAPTLDADNADMATTLLGMDLSADLHRRVRAAVAPGDGFPTVEALSATNRSLQELLAAVPDSPALRALLGRMIERERSLNTSSWSSPA
jgi:hypothetical protein